MVFRILSLLCLTLSFHLFAQDERAPRLVPGTSLELIPIEPGSFLMGSDEGNIDEKPVHKVTLAKVFWMGKTEVTNGDYDRFVKESGYDGTSDAGPDYLRHHRDWGDIAGIETNHPVVCVSWSNAVAFCSWVTERERSGGRLPEGFVYRLPTEAEWEYAARGGKKGKETLYAGSDEAEEVAWFLMNSDRQTHKVGRLRPNELGLYDMSGNVWEWCLDYHVDHYDTATVDGSPVTKPAERRAGRGGSWGYSSWNLRVSYRAKGHPKGASCYAGFRVCLGPDYTE